MTNSQIIFKPVTIDVKSSSIKNFDSSIMKNENGKEVPIVEYTGIIFQKYSGYAPNAFPKPGKQELVPNPAEKRDYIKIKLDPNDSNAMELKQMLLNYDKQYESNFNLIFDQKARDYLNKEKNNKKVNEYEFKPSIKEVDRDDDDDEEPVEGAKPKSEDYYFDTCKLKLDMTWAYYYNDKKLDEHNTKIIKKAIGDKKKSLKGATFDKNVIENIEVNLEFKDENSDEINKVKVKLSEVPSKKTHINTSVFMRKPTEIIEGIKKPNECTEEELDKFYGDPKHVIDCNSPEEFEKYYKNYSYVRFAITPEKVRFWNMAGKKECAINYVIKQIEIIREPYVTNNVKQNYKEYSFRNRKELLIDQSVDNQYKETEKVEKVVKVEKTEKTEKTVETKKLQVEESESESEVEDDAEDSESEGSDSEESEESGDSESEESESESKSEQKAKTTAKKVSKTQVEETKADKQTKKQIATKKK